MEQAGKTPTKEQPQEKEVGRIVFIITENTFEVLLSNNISDVECYSVLYSALQYLEPGVMKTTSKIIH